MNGWYRSVYSLLIVLSLQQMLPTRLPAAETVPAGQAAPAQDQPVKKDVAVDGSVKQVPVLTLSQCIENALKKSPSLFAAVSTMNATQSRVGQARSSYYPQISATAGYSKYTVASDPSSTVYDQYSASATLSQTIFDFGKTWNNVTVKQRYFDASQQDLRTAMSQLVLNVKQSYYALLQAGKNRDVLKETVMQFEQHLNQAKGFYEIGVKSKFDVTKAEVDLSNARLNLIKAENSLKIARVTLNNAMGMPDAPEYSIEDTLPFQKNAITYDEARQRAYANRPDLRSLEAQGAALDASISAARKGYFPTLSGNASYTKSGDTYPPDQKSWSAGLTLTFPLFSGFLTNYQVKEAKENLNIVKGNEETLRQSILLDVQQAYLNLQAAEESVSVAGLTVQQAEENFAIAKGRYEAGVGSPIEETDALVALSNARTSNIAALSDYKVAEATLMKAMGE